MVDAKTGALGHVGVAITFGLVIMAMIYARRARLRRALQPGRDARVRAHAALPVAARRRLLGRAARRRARRGRDPARLARQHRPRRRDATRAAPTARRSSGRPCSPFFLMFVIMAVATDTRAVGEAAAIAIGGTVGLDAMFGGPITGASMNPARSLGPGTRLRRPARALDLPRRAARSAPRWRARLPVRSSWALELVPGRRVVHPAAADHRRDDLHLGELLGRARRAGRGRGRRGRRGSRGGACRGGARRRRARPARRMVACSACSTVTACSGCHAGRSSSVRRTPARIPASGSSSSIGASEPFATTRARVEQRAERVGAVGLPGPEALGEVAVGRRVAELHRRGDAELGEARHVLRREQLRVLDPRGAGRAAATSSRVSSNASSASRFARSPIACTATGQPGRARRGGRSPRAPRGS